MIYLIGLLFAVMASACTLNETLRAAASKAGVHVGTCLHDGGDSTYYALSGKQFSLITPENECKFAETQPSQNSFSYSGCDQILSYASQAGQVMRGHNLIWGAGNPSWLTNGGFNANQLQSILVNHITNVVSHYKGRVPYWDVVNEAIADGSASLKDTIWYPAVSNYIDLAFQTAHSADPSAKLFYNDYSADSVNTKSNYMYSMVQSMLQRGIPIHGVGLQMHIGMSGIDESSLKQNIQRFVSLGLEVHITEMDVSCPSSCNEAQQASIYSTVANACLSISGCTNFEVWGVDDAVSWLGSSDNPLLFDGNYNSKPAACSVLEVFQTYA